MIFNNQTRHISFTSNNLFLDFRKTFSMSTYQTKQISLFSNSNVSKILKLVPKCFTLTTKNGSFHFNTYILKDTSSVIENQLKKDPSNLQFYLDIDGSEEVLRKFEQMYQGEYVIFCRDELPICWEITKTLNIVNCPEYLNKYIYTGNDSFGVQIDFNSFKGYFQHSAPHLFTISTKTKEYKCNIFSIYLSGILTKLCSEDPTLNSYFYDYDDDFQLICDLFDFKSVVLTRNNMETIKKIAEDLEINDILDKVNEYINSTENVSKSIDEQQVIIDSIDELFDLLYNIKEKTVEKAREDICKSKWSRTEDGVKELAAFIIQVVKSGFVYHPYIMELLVQLDQCQNESNKLDILISFLAKRLMYSVFNFISIGLNSKESLSKMRTRTLSLPSIGFVYKLYKRGFITKEELNANLKEMSYSNISKESEKYIRLILLWFFPELMEVNKSFVSSIIPNLSYSQKKGNTMQMQCKNPNISSFIQSFLPYDIEKYKRMRDKGEPEDKITNAIRKDDVDTVQSIISKSEVDISECFIPYNIFDSDMYSTNINYLDYAALNASIKCFKYLLLNHLKINKNTFSYAVQGGNIEIIKIVDQKERENCFQPVGNDNNNFFNGLHLGSYDKNNYDVIKSTIIMHQNDLFDWILDERLKDQCKNNDFLLDLIVLSVENGNAHSLISIIDKGFNLLESLSNVQIFIRESTENGFYKLTQLIFNLVKDKISIEFDNIEVFMNFENTSILKLLVGLMKDKDILHLVQFAVQRNSLSIINYYFSKIATKSHNLESNESLKLLNESLDQKTSDLFFCLLKNITHNDPSISKSFSYMLELLTKACHLKKVEVAKTIINIMIDNKLNEDFSSIFVIAAESNVNEICKYLIDKKVLIKYEFLAHSKHNLGYLNEEIFSFVINNVGPEARFIILDSLENAIRDDNKALVKMLIKENHLTRSSLLFAVNTNDSELVDIILQHNSSPSFINQANDQGTALMIAAKNNNLQIVQRLLSIPGINPSLYINEKITPLILAIDNNNIEIINAILDFYGKDIQNQKWQIETAFTHIIKNKNSLYMEYDKENILINIISKKYIDPNIIFDNNTLLTFAVSIDNINLVKLLLKCDEIDPNLYQSNNGNTPLHIAIQNNNNDIAKLLIDFRKTNINASNFDGFTPLILAATKNNVEIVELLINNEKFNPEESSIDLAFHFLNGEFSKLFSTCKSLDVNYISDLITPFKITDSSFQNLHIDSFQNMNYFAYTGVIKTPLIRAVEDNDNDKIDYIINHPSFDKFKSQIKVAIIESVVKNKIEIFRKLIKIADNDVNIIDTCGQSLLYHAAMCFKFEILKEIMNNRNFDSKKSDILNVFANLNAGQQELIEMKEYIYQYDQEHYRLIDFTKLLPNGKSFFTEICYNNCPDVVYDYLVEKGVDVNMPDQFGIYPLQHAITYKIYSFVIKMINSEEVDLTRKIKNSDSKDTTYLHLLASVKKPMVDAFNMLLSKKVFDINVTDEIGNTPLITAVQFGSHEIVELLLKRNDVDCFHRNNNGDDALSIALKKYDCFKDIKTSDPNEYRDLLLKAVNNNEEYIKNFAIKSQMKSNANHFGIDANRIPSFQSPNQSSWNFNFTNSLNSQTFQSPNFNFNFEPNQ